MPSNSERLSLLAIIGPGLAIAVAGIGALDVTATALAGAKYGLGLLWLPVVVVVFKYVLNEGVARWQLGTGETLLEGFAERMHPVARYALAVYLVVWTPVVFSTLARLTGVTAELMCPLKAYLPGTVFGQECAELVWTGVCITLMASLSLYGGYRLFELLVFFSAATMFAFTVASTIMVLPATHVSLSFDLAADDPEFVLTMFGGVGGTMSIFLYGYWIRDRGRTTTIEDGSQWQRNWLKISRIDLLVSYSITLVFAICMIVLVGGATSAQRQSLQDAEASGKGRLEISEVLELIYTRAATDIGLAGIWQTVFERAFSIAIFATVASSLLGMLQGGPYMFADVLGIVLRKPREQLEAMTDTKSATYRTILIMLGLISIPLVFFTPTGVLAVAAMVWGALIIPFLTMVLMYLNNRSDDMAEHRNGVLSNLVLVLCLLSFTFLAGHYILDRLS